MRVLMKSSIIDKMVPVPKHKFNTTIKVCFSSKMWPFPLLNQTTSEPKLIISQRRMITTVCSHDLTNEDLNRQL